MLKQSKAVKENMLRTFEYLSRNNPLIHLIKDDQVIRFETEFPIPLFNRVFDYQPAPGKDWVEEMKAIAGAYQKRGFKCGWHTYSIDSNEEVTGGLESSGFTYASNMSGMALELGDWERNGANLPAAPNGRGQGIEQDLEIRVVRTEEELEIFKNLFIAEYQLPEEMEESFNRIYSIDGNEDAGVRYYLAYKNAAPVGTLMTSSHGTVGGIYSVATLKAFRRQGIGNALVVRALSDLKAEGMQLAVLQASAMGQGLYSRLGFKEVLKIHVYTT